MKIKKLYAFSDKRQVWRLLLSESEKLIIETRNTEEKEVYFHCLDLFTGKKIFQKYQPDEKYWVSIETVENDIIFFHKYAKPDMPGHKHILAFDINSRKILWENDRYIFLFMNKKGLYVYEKSITGNKYFLLKPETGEVLEELDIEEAEIIKLSFDASESRDYSFYLFPDKYFPREREEKKEGHLNLIFEEINLLEIVGPVEYVSKDNILFFNFHFKSKEKLSNKLLVKDSVSGEEFFSMVINDEVNAYAPDSFFLYKNLLLFLKNKKEVYVCKIID